MASDPEAYTVGWLKRGLVATMIIGNDDQKAWNSEHGKYAVPVYSFYLGFICGCNGMCLAVDSGHALDLTSPPNNSLDLRKTSPAIMTFIQKHELPDGMPARSALAAWYFAEHPKSNERDKMISDAFIKEGLEHMSQTPKPDQSDLHLEVLRKQRDDYFKQGNKRTVTPSPSPSR